MEDSTARLPQAQRETKIEPGIETNNYFQELPEDIICEILCFTNPRLSLYAIHAYLYICLSNSGIRADGSDGSGQPYEVEEFNPQIEITETLHSFILTVHLPGFKRDNVRVEIDNTGTLILSGQRRFQEMGLVRWTWQKRERCRRFRKSLIIPDYINLDAIAGRFERGAFYIFMPKSRPEELKRIGVLGQIGETRPQEEQEPVPADDEQPERAIRIEDITNEPEEPPSLDPPLVRVISIPEAIEPSNDESDSPASEAVEAPKEEPEMVVPDEMPEEDVKEPEPPEDSSMCWISSWPYL